MAQIPDLWPDIVEADQVTPVSILKAQAASLAQKTGNLLVGETRTESYGDEFRHWFYVYAPTLDYRLPMIEIIHPLEFYPLDASAWGGGRQTIANEEEFLHWIGEVLTSQRTRKAIQSLIAQVKSA